MPDIIEYNTFHPAAEDNEEGTVLPPSSSGNTGGDEEVGTKITAVLSPSKKIGLGVLFVGLMTIVVTAISKNNAGNRTSATKLPMYGSCGWEDCSVPVVLGSCDVSSCLGVDICWGDCHCRVAATGKTTTWLSEICWQAYEGDLSDNKPMNPPQYCWTKASTRSGGGGSGLGGVIKSIYERLSGYADWEACKPLGSWKVVNRASDDCSDRCEELENPCYYPCWQAYEGDLNDNKPIDPPQYCWTYDAACKPLGSWKFVNNRAFGDCSDRCEECRKD